MEKLGTRLKRLRLSENLTAEQVAKQLNISTSTYREWEYGRSIQGEPYVELAKIFKVSLYELMTGEYDKTGAQALIDRLTSARQLLEKIENDLRSFF